MAPLTPELALAYLSELSTDIRAAVILGAAGERLAGDAALDGPARDLLGATDASTVEVLGDRGGVFAARSPSHAIAVVAGRFALPALMRYDLRMVLADLEPAVP